MDGSKMNPLAAIFNPQNEHIIDPAAPPRPTATNQYELRLTDDRGFGLFATALIPRGTLIICEPPLLSNAAGTLAQVWAPYNDLTDELKAVFDGLCSAEHLGLDLEQLSRAYLANHVDTLLPNGDITSEIASHTRIMKIFAANHFDGCTVYATASRLNHSCLPNVHHSTNPTLGALTVHAVRDILPNEELTMTYIGPQGMYHTSAERIAYLQSTHHFVCRCLACSDPTGTSDGRRLFMKNLAWGLSQFNQGMIAPHPYIPNNPIAALKQAEDHISSMMDEGTIAIELANAYRVASCAALTLGDLDRALEYALDEEVVERNCLGTHIKHLRKMGSATEIWLNVVFAAIGAVRGEEAAMAYRSAIRGEKKKKKKKEQQKADTSESKESEECS